MARKLITPPAIPPVSLEYIKAKLRIDHSDSDDDLEAYLNSATDLAQEWLGRALVTQTWQLILDEFPDHEIEIPMPPLQSVVSVSYYDAAGDFQVVSTGDYTIDTASAPGWIVPNDGVDWPTTLEAINAVIVEFVAGWNPGNSPEDNDVPAAIKQAITLMVKYWYDGEMDVDQISLPIGVEPLLRKYRVLFGMR